MTHLATFNNELDAEILASRLKEAGIEYKITQKEGNEDCTVLVFEDDLVEATEIREFGSGLE